MYIYSSLSYTTEITQRKQTIVAFICNFLFDFYFCFYFFFTLTFVLLFWFFFRFSYYLSGWCHVWVMVHVVQCSCLQLIFSNVFFLLFWIPCKLQVSEGCRLPMSLLRACVWISVDLVYRKRTKESFFLYPEQSTIYWVYHEVCNIYKYLYKWSASCIYAY